MFRRHELVAIGTGLCLLARAGAVRAQDTVTPPEASKSMACVPACPSDAGYVCEDGRCTFRTPTPRWDTQADQNPLGNFQLAFRLGAQAPFGQVTGYGQDPVSGSFSPQGALVTEIGWKFSPNLFAGLYGSLGLGGTSGTASAACSQANFTCYAITWRAGLEVLYHFEPASPINPWVGYGIGYESSAIDESNDSGFGRVTASGWEFGHFMAGIDFLVSRKVAIGPLLDLALGEYTRLTSSTDFPGEAGSSGGSIAHTALHEWLFVGGRLVVFP
jgi:outer membrane protein W